MKIKLLVPIVLIILLSSSTIVMAAKPSDLPEQAYSKGKSEANGMDKYFHLEEIAFRLWQKNGIQPRGLLNAMGIYGR